MIPKWWEQIDDDCPVAKTPVNVFKMNDAKSFMPPCNLLIGYHC